MVYSQLMIRSTLRCSEYCGHCLADAAPNKNIHLPIELAKRATDYWWQLNHSRSVDNGGTASRIILDGGDALLYRHLREYLQYARDIPVPLWLRTGGMLFKTKYQRTMTRLKYLRTIRDFTLRISDWDKYHSFKGPEAKARMREVEKEGIKVIFKESVMGSENILPVERGVNQPAHRLSLDSHPHCKELYGGSSTLFIKETGDISYCCLHVPTPETMDMKYSQIQEIERNDPIRELLSSVRGLEILISLALEIDPDILKVDAEIKELPKSCAACYRILKDVDMRKRISEKLEELVAVKQ